MLVSQNVNAINENYIVGYFEMIIKIKSKIWYNHHRSIK
jgi:hypothetical protein